MYEIQFEKKALDFLNKLEHSIKKRIWDRLQKCKQEPFRYLKHLTQIKGYKLRVGDYRIIIDVQNKINVLYVLKIGNRKNVYEDWREGLKFKNDMIITKIKKIIMLINAFFNPENCLKLFLLFFF